MRYNGALSPAGLWEISKHSHQLHSTWGLMEYDRLNDMCWGASLQTYSASCWASIFFLSGTLSAGGRDTLVELKTLYHPPINAKNLKHGRVSTGWKQWEVKWRLRCNMYRFHINTSIKDSTFVTYLVSFCTYINRNVKPRGFCIFTQRSVYNPFVTSVSFGGFSLIL